MTPPTQTHSKVIRSWCRKCASYSAADGRCTVSECPWKPWSDRIVYDPASGKGGGTSRGYRVLVQGNGGIWTPGWLKAQIYGKTGGYSWSQTRTAFTYEVSVLRQLDARGCTHVPKALTGLLADEREGVPRIYYAMTEATGVEWNALDGMTLSPAENRRALFALCEALCDLHQAGFGHYDLKPQNLLYDASAGRVVLIDIGSAKGPPEWRALSPENANDPGIEGNRAGTVPFVSPEQMRLCLRDLTPESDAYAFGLLFCQRFLGGIVDENMSRVELVESLHGAGVSWTMARLVAHRALSRKPESRIGSLAAILFQMAREKWGIPTLEIPVPKLPAVPIPPDSHAGGIGKIVGIVGAILVVALAATAGTAILFRLRPAVPAVGGKAYIQNHQISEGGQVTSSAKRNGVTASDSESFPAKGDATTEGLGAETAQQRAYETVFVAKFRGDFSPVIIKGATNSWEVAANGVFLLPMPKTPSDADSKGKATCSWYISPFSPCDDCRSMKFPLTVSSALSGAEPKTNNVTPYLEQARILEKFPKKSGLSLGFERTEDRNGSRITVNGRPVPEVDGSISIPVHTPVEIVVEKDGYVPWTNRISSVCFKGKTIQIPALQKVDLPKPEPAIIEPPKPEPPKVASDTTPGARPVSPAALLVPTSIQDAPAVEAVRAASGPVSVFLDSKVYLEMIPCPTVAPGFWMGKCEVTQEQWGHVMGNNPSCFKNPKNPVETVSWNDCQKFIERLNSRPQNERMGLEFRIPSEEEWRLSCLAGARDPRGYGLRIGGVEVTGDKLGEVAWYRKNSNGQPHPVGQKTPNAFGLYDMYGNVFEWVRSDKGDIVSVGGSWSFPERYCRADSRRQEDGSASSSIGFRLAATSVQSLE